MTIWYECRHKKNMSGFVYLHVDVDIFSRFIVKRFLKGINKVKRYLTVLS